MNWKYFDNRTITLVIIFNILFSAFSTFRSVFDTESDFVSLVASGCCVAEQTLTSQDVVLVVVVGLCSHFDETRQTFRRHELWNQVFIILQRQSSSVNFNPVFSKTYSNIILQVQKDAWRVIHEVTERSNRSERVKQISKCIWKQTATNENVSYSEAAAT